jgi:hypothetical protein
MAAPLDFKRKFEKRPKKLSGDKGGGGSGTGDPDKEARIAKLNKSHAGVMIGGKFCVLNEVVDPIFGRPNITLSSVQDFRHRYSNELIWTDTDRGSKSHSVASEWLASPNRRDYQGIIFSPGEDKPGYYNLYRGLAFKPKKGDWHLLRNHIEENICGGIGLYSTYLFGWMADAVQDPGGMRPGTSIVLRGGRGTGKGLFAGSFGRIFGSHYLHLRDQNHLTGRFNSHQKDALMIFADECFWAGNKTSEGLLKGLITEPTFQIEQKGKDPICVQNHIRLIIASNETWVVPAGLDERRFFVLDVKEEHKQDISYWNPIWEETRNGGIEAMLYDLMRLKYDKQSLRTPPKTWGLLDQIECSMDAVQQFWYGKLRDGSLLKDKDSWDSAVQASKFYDEFMCHCRNIGERFAPNEKVFGKQIRKLCPGVKRHRLTPIEGGGGQVWHLVFPELSKCRLGFDAILGMKLEWEDIP